MSLSFSFCGRVTVLAAVVQGDRAWSIGNVFFPNDQWLKTSSFSPTFSFKSAKL
ncbi:hypothetical protein BH10PLA2_BH10PLA2_37890 [soil metagenome]